LERKVSLKLLFSKWDHTKPDMLSHLKSLLALNGVTFDHVKVEGKLFQVPAFTPDQAKIPFARVNHNKYMVTDKHGYIGTSNWSADYFVNTGGIGFIFQCDNSTTKNNKFDLHQQLQGVFQRDWSSDYSHDLS
jgi:phospholipase D3/4